MSIASDSSHRLSEASDEKFNDIVVEDDDFDISSSSMNSSFIRNDKKDMQRMSKNQQLMISADIHCDHEIFDSYA